MPDTIRGRLLEPRKSFDIFEDRNFYWASSRPLGRPPLKWEGNVSTDASWLGWDCRAAAQGRSGWRQIAALGLQTL